MKDVSWLPGKQKPRGAHQLRSLVQTESRMEERRFLAEGLKRELSLCGWVVT
jgi:hypothetical protein